MDIALSVAAFLLSLIGIAGCILPVIPGVVLSYAGLLCAAMCSYSILIGKLLIASEAEKKIRSCGIGRSVTLCYVRPVNYVIHAVIADNNVTRSEITVANLVMGMHTGKTLSLIHISAP